MAISNAYKPGWRSRRRSRLSLVERSVPKLGRVAVPEQGSKPEPPSDRFKPAGADAGQHVETGKPLELPSSSEPMEQQPEPSPAEAVEQQALPSSRHAEMSERAPSVIEPIAPGHSDGVEPDASSDDEPEFELSEELGASDNVPSPDVPSPDVAASQPFSPPRIVTDADGRGPETRGLPARQEMPEGRFDIGSLPAAVNAKISPVKIELDWETLIPSGLVDPRDRTQPLPANMDEIARALIRQALSDQSSWRDRIILVSSARESRAKSMAAINFAFALTTIDRHSVVLLDANMDGSGVGAHLGAGDHPGLTTALCDSTVETAEISLETSLDRLTLVTSGGFEEDILDQFASRRMLEILRFLTKDPHTLLVLDAPPILSSQEATVLSVIAGQVVLVVEAGVTDENSINHALKRIGDRHNVSLVLSKNSGITSEKSMVEETPASRRLALPKPKRSMPKRRLRKAVASFVIGIGVGVSALWGVAQPSSSLSIEDDPGEERSNSTSSVVKIMSIAPPQIGGDAR